jgi:tRNA-dihydrouridine synthase A
MTPHALSPWRFSVAPMMDWTDRHCRAFHRVLSREALLYTEMVTAEAVIHGDRARILGWSPADEGRVALQLGGNRPGRLAEAARIGEQEGYAEINLNCGCPSDRVQGGAFGACLMRTPALVGESVAAMKAATRLPVTVKCRIGVDEQEPREALWTLVAACQRAGVDAMIVHARKAWLKGLSPKENREIPPLDHALVQALKADHPRLPIALNGGLADPAGWRGHLERLDGIMVGREAYQNPQVLLAVDPDLFGRPAPVANGVEALEAFEPYMARQLAAGVRLHALTRHLLGLFPGQPGARAFRRRLAMEALRPDAGLDVLRAALAEVTDAARRRETSPAVPLAASA